MQPEPPEDVEAEAAKLEDQVRELRDADYTVESKSTRAYNCLAWAAGDCTQQWGPSLTGGYFWPDDLPVGIPMLSIVVDLFKKLGYTSCADGAYVPGVEKVALYADELGEVRHAARQAPGGRWLSKMGGLADISHANVEDVEGPMFGVVRAYLERVGGTPTSSEEPPSIVVVASV